MDYKDAIAIFENNTKRSVVQIERCSVGIANYVFIVSTANEKFVLRCSKDENAYIDTGKRDSKNILEQLKNDEDYVQGILRYFCK